MALIDEVKNLLTAYGLGSLAQWIVDQQVAGADDLTIVTDLRKRPEYKARFPAMEELQKAVNQGGAGGMITEADYISMEQAYMQAFQGSGLPANMFDSPDDFKRLIAARVSPNEVQRRVAAAKEAVDATDPNVRTNLLRMYGITTTDLMAYALDPAKNADYLQRVATTSMLAGFGTSAGVSGLNRNQWEGYAQDLINEQASPEDIRTIISNAHTIADTQTRLAGIEGDQFTTSDALDITVRKDSSKTLASKRRADREKARFSGSQGLGSKGLSGSGI